MKSFFATLVLLATASAMADVNVQKLKCSTVKNAALTAKLSGKITLSYDERSGITSGSAIADKIELFSNYGKKKGSVFTNMQLQGIDGEIGYEGDYLLGTLLPIVDHGTVNRIVLAASQVGMRAQLVTNKGNEYQMNCKVSN